MPATELNRLALCATLAAERAEKEKALKRPPMDKMIRSNDLKNKGIQK